jgi:protein-tyrosine kinase
MDRIRKALDLTRQERDRSLAAPEGGDPRSVEAGGVRLPAVIQYTRTQIFSPAPALLESNRIIGPASSHPAAAALRMLRTQVLLRLHEHNWRSMAIMSAGSNEGKTTTAINLGISLASDHRHTVLLVDFDLKRPTIASSFGITPAKGVDDVLRGEAAVEECLYHPEGFDRFVILPARSAMQDSSEALAGPRGLDLVTKLRGRYPDRILLFDLPPILGADDALAFAPMVECGLLVVAEGTTRREDVVRCMELLHRTPIVGTVLNQATDVMSPYG